MTPWQKKFNKYARFRYCLEILLNTVHGFYFNGQAKEVSKMISNYILFYFFRYVPRGTGRGMNEYIINRKFLFELQINK